MCKEKNVKAQDTRFKTSKLKDISSPHLNSAFLIVSVILLVSLSFTAFFRNITWEYDLTLWDDVIRKGTNKARTYNNRGNAYADKDQHDMAIKDYNKAIALDPNDAAAYNNRGNVYADKGQHDMAIKDYNKAIALDPNDAYAYNNRGFAYGKKGQYDRAIEDFNKAIALDPNYAKAYNNRGNAYALSGIINRAVSDFQKACDMGSEDGCRNLQKVLKNR